MKQLKRIVTCFSKFSALEDFRALDYHNVSNSLGDKQLEEILLVYILRNTNHSCQIFQRKVKKVKNGIFFLRLDIMWLFEWVKDGMISKL